MISNICVEFSSVLSTLSSSVDAISEKGSVTVYKKRKKKATKLDVSLGHVHNLIKAEVARQTLDHPKELT